MHFYLGIIIFSESHCIIITVKIDYINLRTGDLFSRRENFLPNLELPGNTVVGEMSSKGRGV